MSKIKIRQSQTIYTYAPGAIGDFPGLSVMFLTHDNEERDWGKIGDPNDSNSQFAFRRIVKDKRLADAFGIEYFVLPPLELSGNKVSVVRFPQSLYCPNCGTINFVKELENYADGKIPLRKKSITFDEELEAYYCIECRESKKGLNELIPTRFIIANEEGFIDDFPWDWYVHRDPGKRNERGKGHKLRLEFKSSSASLSSIILKSFNRQTGKFIAEQNLGEIFNQDLTFISAGDEYLTSVASLMPKPWLGRDKNGNFIKVLINDVPSPSDIQRDNGGNIIGDNQDQIKRKYPRTLQRGANNLFFPLVFKGIRLPYSVNNIDEDLVSKLLKIKKLFQEQQPSTYLDYSNTQWRTFFTNAKHFNTALTSYDDVIYLEALNELFPNDQNKTQTIDKKKVLRREEFNCFCDLKIKDSKTLWYKARHINPGNSFLKDFIEKIILLDKINELKVYKGFTRIKPMANEELMFLDNPKDLAGNRLIEYYRINESRKFPLKTNDFPCAEVKGEGIFLKFKDDVLEKWEEKETVKARFSKMKANLENYFTTFGIENGLDNINARYVLLHSLSHMIMQQLSNESGYNLSSLTEIIYCSVTDDRTPMNGILIYTSSSDNEGTLGGLVDKGTPENLSVTFSKAIDKAKWCSSDPLCITSQGQGFMTTNMAACYSCVMVPETCCENLNKYLDRKLLLDFFDIETL